ncbi:hypothetical protein [Spirosoma jeollabukense]
MKQTQPRQKSKLTKGLLIVALLLSLFAFLGNVGNCPNRLAPTTGIELFAANTLAPYQHGSAVERPRPLTPTRFFAHHSCLTVALLAYNKLIGHQISLVCGTPPLPAGISKFFQRKTIPASSEAPYANFSSSEFPANLS